MTLREKILHRKYLLGIKKKLYKKYCQSSNSYREYNKERIDYVISNVLSKQMLQLNPYELEALLILSNRGIQVKYQEPIPILSLGGKLEHLYIADMVVGNTIIEIDGNSHSYKEKYDSYRDDITAKVGYITKRFKSSEIYKLKEETFV